MNVNEGIIFLFGEFWIIYIDFVGRKWIKVLGTIVNAYFDCKIKTI